MNFSEMKWYDKAFYALAKAVATVLIALLHPLKISGAENLPKNGSFIIIANHVAMWDVFFISRMLFPLRTLYMAKEELFSYGALFSWIIRCSGGFPVKRGTADIGAIKRALSTIKEGHVFGIFPEGTRNKKWEGKLQRFFNGVGYIALASKAPVIPVFFADTEGFRVFRKVRVFVGEPVNLEDLLQLKITSESTEKATEHILHSVNALIEKSATMVV